MVGIALQRSLSCYGNENGAIVALVLPSTQRLCRTCSRACFASIWLVLRCMILYRCHSALEGTIFLQRDRAVRILSNRVRLLLLGGLAEEVDDKMIHAAFIPFGDITDVNIPIDYETSKHRGFAFLEYELAEDAAAAIDNMNESELCGRTIRVNIAKPMKNKEGGSRAVWNSDDWLQKHAANEGVTGNSENDEEQKTNGDVKDEVSLFDCCLA